jgi:hypothetical protein
VSKYVNREGEVEKMRNRKKQMEGRERQIKK